jgi:hypothetical protein
VKSDKVSLSKSPAIGATGAARTQTGDARADRVDGLHADQRPVAHSDGADWSIRCRHEERFVRDECHGIGEAAA